MDYDVNEDVKLVCVRRRHGGLNEKIIKLNEGGSEREKDFEQLIFRIPIIKIPLFSKLIIIPFCVAKFPIGGIFFFLKVIKHRFLRFRRSQN